MPILEINNISYGNITKVVSGSNPEDFWLRTNYIIFDGVLYFGLLIILWFIVFLFAQKGRDQPLHNAFYSSLIVSVFGFFTRAIYGTLDGAGISLLTDAQLWIFPIIAAILGAILWATKRE